MKTLRVGKFPGVLQEVLVADETTVREVLEMAGLDSTGYQIELDVVGMDVAINGGNLLLQTS